LLESAELAARWKRLHELDPDVKVNIVDLNGQAAEINAAAIAGANAWLAQHGLA